MLLIGEAPSASATHQGYGVKNAASTKCVKSAVRKMCVMLSWHCYKTCCSAAEDRCAKREWGGSVRIASVAAAFVLMASSAAAQEASRFDLRCEGTVQERLNGPLIPKTFVLHVDLQAMEYCFDACDTVLAIEQVLSDRIVFVQDDERAARRNVLRQSEVSRVTGEYRNVWIESHPIPFFYETLATCEATAFTPFPARRF